MRKVIVKVEFEGCLVVVFKIRGSYSPLGLGIPAAQDHVRQMTQMKGLGAARFHGIRIMPLCMYGMVPGPVLETASKPHKCLLLRLKDPNYLFFLRNADILAGLGFQVQSFFRNP